jgi:hypothetical protein
VHRLLALTVVLLVGSASGATAGHVVNVQFRLRFTKREAFSGSLAGTFRATGAISAAGTVAENYMLSAPRLRDQQPVESVAGASTLNMRTGVLRVSYTGVVSSASPTMTVTEGRWKVTGGTGRFSRLSGGGRFSAIVDLARRTMVKRYDGLLR